MLLILSVALIFEVVKDVYRVVLMAFLAKLVFNDVLVYWRGCYCVQLVQSLEGRGGLVSLSFQRKLDRKSHIFLSSVSTYEYIRLRWLICISWSLFSDLRSVC